MAAAVGSSISNTGNVIGCLSLYISFSNIHGPWDEALPDTHAGPRTPEERLYHENWTENGNRAGSDNDA